MIVGNCRSSNVSQHASQVEQSLWDVCFAPSMTLKVSAFGCRKGEVSASFSEPVED